LTDAMREAPLAVADLWAARVNALHSSLTLERRKRLV
jgi:hypothetical protein